MADEYVVRVRVGAGLDTRSFDATFADATKRAQKAAQEVAKATRTSERQTSRDRVDSARSAEKEVAAAQRAMLAQQRSEMRQFASEQKRIQKEVARAERTERQEVHREALMLFRAEQRARRDMERQNLSAARAAQRERERFASRTSYRTTRFLFPAPEGILGYGRRVGMDIARGVGMDWSLGAGLQRNTSNQEAAIRLSNQGYIPGQGRFEDRIKAGSLRSTAQGIAGQFGIAEGDILGAMSRFTDVTGDLKTAQETIGEIALLSAATGTSIEDAAAAAADMSMQLGNIPDKSKRVAELLGVAAMGGKQGAVEMKDLARYVPKLAAAAPSFSGDVGANITKMLAAAQTARQFGGAASAAQAATSVASMVNTLKTPARVKEFEAHGVKVYNKSGGIRDIQDIIKESIIGSKGSMTEFKKMWANVQGARAVEGFMNIYRQAGGGKSGLSAIDEQFKKFTAGIDKGAQGQLARSATDADARKAQQFQIAMDRTAQKLQADLMPTLIQLQPTIVRATEAFAGLVSFVTNHLPTSIAAAFALAAGRAFAESWMRRTIDRALAGRPTVGGVNGMAGGILPGGARAAGGGATPVSIVNTAMIGAAVGAAIVGGITELASMRLANANKTLESTKGDEGLFGKSAKERADQLQAELDKQMEDNFGGEGDSGWTKSWKTIWAGLKDTAGVSDSEDMDVKRQRIHTLRGREAWSDQSQSGLYFNKSFQGDVERRQQAASAEDIGSQVAEQLGSKILKVHVNNLPTAQSGSGPQVDPNGRAPAPGNRAP